MEFFVYLLHSNFSKTILNEKKSFDAIFLADFFGFQANFKPICCHGSYLEFSMAAMSQFYKTVAKVLCKPHFEKPRFD